MARLNHLEHNLLWIKLMHDNHISCNGRPLSLETALTLFFPSTTAESLSYDLSKKRRDLLSDVK